MTGFFADANANAQEVAEQTLDALKPYFATPTSDFMERAIQARMLARTSQRQVADALGIDNTRYSRYERNRSMVPFDMVVAISKLLDVPLESVPDGGGNDAYRAGFRAGVRATQAAVDNYVGSLR